MPIASPLILLASCVALPIRPELAAELTLTPTAAQDFQAPRFQGELRLRVRNAGGADAAATTFAVFEDLDGDGLRGAGEPALAVLPLPALAACTATELVHTLDLPLTFRGSPLKVELDDAGTVAESNEDNDVVDAFDGCRDRTPIDWTPQLKWT